jgi:anti-repressor protein
MNQLTNIQQTMSSREIAELTGKDHRNVLRDCDNLNQNYESLSLLKIEQGHYIAENGQKYRCYELTKMQTIDLMTGYNIELRIKINRRWEELESNQKAIDFSNPNTVLQLAQNWADEQAKRIEAETKLKEQAPQVAFAMAMIGSTSTCLIGQLAKIITQNGYEIGEKRLFAYLRDKGYLGKSGENYNIPSQRYIEQGLFEIKKGSRTGNGGILITTQTPKVTGKGQQYFINHFLNNQISA